MQVGAAALLWSLHGEVMTLCAHLVANWEIGEPGISQREECAVPGSPQGPWAAGSSLGNALFTGSPGFPSLPSKAPAFCEAEDL